MNLFKSLGVAVLIGFLGCLTNSGRELGTFVLGYILFGWMIVTGISYFIFTSFEKSNTEREYIKMNNDWISSLPNLPYKYTYSGYGIAIDPQNKKIYLRSSFNKKYIEKEYSFSDVREWRYNITSGGNLIPGQVIGGGLQGAGANIGSAIGTAITNSKIRKQNETESGLFVKVKDINYPEWQIIFSDNENRQIELSRWMEILQQHINENACVPDEYDSEQLTPEQAKEKLLAEIGQMRPTILQFCTKCGNKNSIDAAFCSKCGDEVKVNN